MFLITEINEVVKANLFDFHLVKVHQYWFLTDRDTEYCGKQEHHEYQLYPGIENIDHSKTKARSPQSNGICERFHKTLLDEFYRISYRMVTLTV